MEESARQTIVVFYKNPNTGRSLGTNCVSISRTDNDTIRQALDEVDEDAAAWAAIENKLYRWRELEKAEFEQKAVAFLARRGFNFEIARRAAARAWQETQSE